MDRAELVQHIDRMVTENRDRCLWFLKRDYFPGDDRMRLKVLDYIQRHGTRDSAREAAQLARWLLPSSNDTSVAS